MKTWTFFLACLCTLFLSSVTMAQDTPISQDILQGAPQAITSKTHASAKKLGQWQWNQKTGLRTTKENDEKNSFWISPLSLPFDKNYHKEYTIRAELILGKRPDSSILFKATFPTDFAQATGYSLSFDHNKVLFHRWDNGYPTAITSAVVLTHVPKRARVYIHTGDAVIDAVITDADTGETVATLQMDDTTTDGTQLGYRVYKKQDKTTALVALDIVKGQNSFAKHKKYSPDAYLTTIPTSYVVAPQKSKSDVLAQCTKLKNTAIEGYYVYRCSHSQMTQLVDKNRKLPDGYYWAEPRNSFTDDEYRKTAVDLTCAVPMHCDPTRPLNPNRSAKDVAMVQSYLDAYVPVCKKHFAHVRLETIGQTYLGYPIRAIVMSNAADDTQLPRVLFNGSHHGMELFATDMAFDVLEQLCEAEDPTSRARYDDALSKLEVWIIPTVNLDGNDLFFHVSNTSLGRKNGRHVFVNGAGKAFPKLKGPYAPNSAYYLYRPNGIAEGAGVDINRNYPLHWGATGEVSSSARPRDYWYRGSAPASEPEIQAMMNLFHTQQFASSISFHTVSTRILSPYSIDALANPPHDEDNAWQLALRMADSAGVQASGKPYQVVKNLYSVDGTDQDWFRMVSGTYAYLIEGALHNPTGKKRTDALVQTRPAWETFLDASRSTTLVRVHDTNGQPIIAEVSYSDVPQLNGEHWMTRCEDGTHAMLCFGPRTITVKLPDGTAQSKTVSCTSAPTVVDFTFDHAPATKWDAFCASGYCDALTSVDTLCALKNNVCPTLPASRYCLIDGACVPAGTEAPAADSESSPSLFCDPAEDNRGWTKKK